MALCLTAVACHASPNQTVWSGVYSEAQAYRGEKVADTTCIGCHGAGLTGGDSGPKLVGEKFLANWSGTVRERTVRLDPSGDAATTRRAR